MLNFDNILMIAASLLLLVVNWLAFHDLGEAHPVRDWITLIASALVIVQFARQFWNKNFRHG